LFLVIHYYFIILEDREGVLDTILRHKNQYQRRSYQCIKGLVGLFMRIPMAHKVVLQNTDLKRKWVEAVDWLQEELNRVLLLFCFVSIISTYSCVILENIDRRPV